MKYPYILEKCDVCCPAIRSPRLDYIWREGEQVEYSTSTNENESQIR